MRSINLCQLGIIVSAKLSGKWPSGSEEEVEYVGKNAERDKQTDNSLLELSAQVS